jgi:hypothetical protein
VNRQDARVLATALATATTAGRLARDAAGDAAAARRADAGHLLVDAAASVLVVAVVLVLARCPRATRG